jgi:hypothetical protein
MKPGEPEDVLAQSAQSSNDDAQGTWRWARAINYHIMKFATCYMTCYILSETHTCQDDSVLAGVE